MKKLIIILLIPFITLAQSWTYKEGGNAFDGKYKTSSVLGKGSDFPYNKPSLVINKFDNDEQINFYLSGAGYFQDNTGISIKWVFDNEPDTIYSSYSWSLSNDGKIIFFKTNLIPRELVVPKDYEKFKTQNFIKFYSDFIKKLKNGNNFSLLDQPEYFGSYYPRLNTKINGWIDWNMNSHDLLSFINAFDDPYEGAATYINNQGSVSTQYDSIMTMFGTSGGGQSKSLVHNITFARAGTYYVWGYDLDNFGTITVSGANSGNISSTSLSNSYVLKATIGVSASQTVAITIANSGEKIVFGFTISTSNSNYLDKTITVNSGVPASGAIDFSDLYGATA